MKKFVVLMVALAMAFVTLQGAFAVESAIDSCMIQDRTGDSLAYVRSNCTGTIVAWGGGANVSVLGDVLPNEIAMGDTFVYVDPVLRPDLDAAALLTFNGVPFAIEPDVKVDGVACANCTQSWNPSTRTLLVTVPGFSNYSLQAVQDFTVYSDPEPELNKKVYQTIDVGDRSTEYKCIVQVYGLNEDGEYILVQTNPQREAQGRLFGDTDPNQPEALGYFKTENGIANVYFDGGALSGYQSFEYVAQCASNSTLLMYEEAIDTRYKPAGREITGRMIWFNSGDNAFYVIIIVVTVFFGMFFAVRIVKMWMRTRGY